MHVHVYATGYVRTCDGVCMFVHVVPLSVSQSVRLSFCLSDSPSDRPSVSVCTICLCARMFACSFVRMLVWSLAVWQLCLYRAGFY